VESGEWRQLDSNQRRCWRVENGTKSTDFLIYWRFGERGKGKGGVSGDGVASGDWEVGTCGKWEY